MLANALYWIVFGMPFVHVFYHCIMDVTVGNTTIAMNRQAVNGVTNALLARALFSGYVHGKGSRAPFHLPPRMCNTPIHHQRGAHHIVARARCQVDRGAGHVLGGTNAAGGDAR